MSPLGGHLQWPLALIKGHNSKYFFWIMYLSLSLSFSFLILSAPLQVSWKLWFFKNLVHFLKYGIQWFKVISKEKLIYLLKSSPKRHSLSGIRQKFTLKILSSPPPPHPLKSSCLWFQIPKLDDNRSHILQYTEFKLSKCFLWGNLPWIWPTSVKFHTGW